MSAAHIDKVVQLFPDATGPAAQRRVARLDFIRAVPIEAALVEAARDALRTRFAARTRDDRAELVCALLLALEGEYLAPVHCFPARAGEGPAHVIVTVGPAVFRLEPEDCRTAASALIAENAFAGCIGIAGDLREAAAVAQSNAPRRLTPYAEAPTHGRTGRPPVSPSRA